MDKRRKKFIETVVAVLIGVLLWGSIFSIPIVLAADLPIPYVIEQKGWRDVYSLSPDASSVNMKTIWRVEVSGGKLSGSFSIEKERGYECFREAAKKIMEIEGVRNLEGREKDGKYYIDPVKNPNSP